jgi:RHS repeat-associated protein
LAAEYSTQPPTMPCATCYLSTDHLGSTRLMTDQNGNPVSRHDFLPFGEELVTSNRTSAQQYGETDNVNQKFTGKERDAESGLDFFKARYFSGAQGRFTNPDPSGLGATSTNPQSWNKYAYVRNSPYKLIDRNGLYPTSVHHEIDEAAFPGLSKDDLAIVMQGSDYQDRMYAGQAPDQAYTHGQEDGFLYDMHEKERGDELVDRLLKEATDLQKQWLESGHAGYNPGSLFRVGQAAHLLQDRTSWFHQSLPRWYGGLAPTDWFHGAFENLYRFRWFRPGDVRQSVQATEPLMSAINNIPVVTSTITYGPVEVVTSTVKFNAPSDSQNGGQR